MAVKVQMGTPSQQLIDKTAAEFDVKDSTGRVITLKKPGFLAHFKIVETVGAELAPNEVYMRMVNPLIYVIAIDGDPVVTPTNKIQIDALITRLGDHGYIAITKGLNEHFGEQDPETEKAALKKS